MTKEMRDMFPPAGKWKWTDQVDGRDLRDPEVLGHRLLKLRDSDELKKKYPLTQVYDFFF